MRFETELPQGFFVVTPHANYKGVPIWIVNTSKGTAEKAKGAIKDAAGKVTGDKKLESEGKLDKAKGSAAHN